METGQNVVLGCRMLHLFEDNAKVVTLWHAILFVTFFLLVFIWQYKALNAHVSSLPVRTSV